MENNQNDSSAREGAENQHEWQQEAIHPENHLNLMGYDFDDNEEEESIYATGPGGRDEDNEDDDNDKQENDDDENSDWGETDPLSDSDGFPDPMDPSGPGSAV